ncbi:SDR family NAD(P)-dependent oxidoreductase [Blastococcus sp. TF02A-30]|uniref:SDR family NAD(P)-dependent oxidoreductase n=1 Tax=Blastococcus sp. TF02A-30 TaxID=2250580 RepID=UPI001F47EFF2|nr:SDR family NAD(P)-dependent oxidoreductase [Blastococcus sp. TF02A-30]
MTAQGSTGARDMAGRVALVTGAASGIGLSTSRLLAERGADVVVVDRDAAGCDAAVAALQATGQRAWAVPADVGDEAAVEAAARRALEEAGQVDVLVNNAGITALAAPLWETSTETFEAMWRVHLMGTFFFCRALVPHMIERGYGRIVNVASVAGKEGNTGSSAYSSAKAGVIGLTKSLGKELATTGVLVNAVTPGIINTPIMASATPEHVARLQAKIPMGRAGEPEEIAELIAWLSSSRCSFSTAAVFDVSGGRTTY